MSMIHLLVASQLRQEKEKMQNLYEKFGADRDRTDGLLLAKQALSQLSYSPVNCIPCSAQFGRERARTSDLTLIRGVL